MWRRQYWNGELGGTRSTAFIPLALSAETQTSALTAPPPSDSAASVEIALRNGRRVVVPANVDPEALARLLPVVDSR